MGPAMELLGGVVFNLPGYLALPEAVKGAVGRALLTEARQFGFAAVKEQFPDAAIGRALGSISRSDRRAINAILKEADVPTDLDDLREFYLDRLNKQLDEAAPR